MDKRKQTCCFTGHRSIKAEEGPEVMRRTEAYIRGLVEKGVVFFEVGGALGYDNLVAELLFRLRDSELPQIKVRLVYPFDGFTEGWSIGNRTKYAQMLPAYDEVICASEKPGRDAYLLRDRILVEHSAHCVCYCTRNSGGRAKRREAENCHRRNSLPPLNDKIVRGLLRQAEAQ